MGNQIQVLTSGPNECMIISGIFHGGEPTMIVGGRGIVIPLVQKIQKLKLSTITLLTVTNKVYTAQGVPLNLTGKILQQSVCASICLQLVTFFNCHQF